MAESLARVVLKFTVDQVATRLTTSAIKALDDRLGDLVVANKAVSKTAGQSNTAELIAAKQRLSLSSALQQAAAQTMLKKIQAANAEAKASEAAKNSYNAEREALLGVADAADKAADAKQGAADVDVGTKVSNDLPQYGGFLSRTESSINNVRQVFGGSSEVGELLNIGGDLLGSARALSELKDQAIDLAGSLKGAGGLTGLIANAGGGFTALGVALVPLALALGGLVLAMKAYNDAMRDQRQALESVLATQKDYFDLLNSGTSEDARNRIKELEASRKSLEAQKAESQKIIDQTFQGLSQQFGDEVGRAIFGRLQVAELKPFYESIDQVNTALSNQTTEQGRLEGALKSGAFAANDAAAAQERLNQARLGGIERTRTNQEQAVQFGQTASPEQFGQRQKELNDGIRSYELAIQAVNKEVEQGIITSAAGASAVADYYTNIANLIEQQKLLVDVSEPLIAARDREAKSMEALKAYADYVADAIKQATQERLTGIRSAVQKEQQYYDDLRSGSSESVRARLTALADEKKAIQRQLPELQKMATTSEDSAAALKDFQNRLADIDADTETLTKDLLPAIQAREREAAAIEKVKDAQKDVADSLLRSAALYGDLVEAQNEYIASTREVEASRGKADRRDEEDFQRGRLKSNTDFYAGIAESDAEHYKSRQQSLDEFAKEAITTENESQQDRLKQLAEYNKESTRNAEDLQRNLVQIEKDTRKAVGEAAANLDATSVQAALSSGQEQAAAAVDQYNLDKKRRDEDFQAQLAEAAANASVAKAQRTQQFMEQQAESDRQFAEQRAKQIAQFQAQQAEEDANRAFARKRELEDRAEEDASRAAAQKKVIAGIQKQLDDENNLRTQKYGVIQQNTSAFLSNLASSFASAYSQIQTAAARTRVSTPAPQPQPTYTPVRGRGFADGGDPPLNRVVRVGERGPENAVFTDPVHIYSAADSRAMANTGGLTALNSTNNSRVINFNAPISITGDVGNWTEPKLKSMFYDAIVEAVG